MVKITKNIVSNAVKNKVSYSGTNTCKYITIHETANTSKGANADTHGRLQANGNSRQASWHYTADDKQVVQSFDDKVQCWHAGSTQGNKESIGIEICVNNDGNFNKAVKNAAELVKILMKRHGISASNVVQHHHWSGKNCPTNLRNGSKGINWNDFKAMLSGKTSSATTTSKPSKPTTSKPKTSGSVVDYMKSKNMDASFGNREKLAKQYGIKNYKGTESQNTKLLAKLKAGKPKPSKPAKKPASSYKGSSLVDYLKSVGQPSSFKHREKLANQKGIINYKGTPSQNTQLLNILRNGSSTKSSGKSVKQMADMIIKGKNVPTGHTAREKWLGIDKATYEKVRAEVNKRM